MSSKTSNYFKMVNEEFSYGDFHRFAKGTGPKVLKKIREVLSRRQVPGGKVLVFHVKLRDGAMLLVNPSTCCGLVSQNEFPQCVVYGNFKQKWVELHHVEHQRASQLHPEMALWSVDPRGQDSPSGIHFTSNKTGTLWLQEDMLNPSILAGDLRPDYPVVGQESWGPLSKGYKIKKISVYTAAWNTAYSARSPSRSISIPSSPATTPRSLHPTTPRSDGTRSMSEDLVALSPPIMLDMPTYVEPPQYLDATGYGGITQPAMLEYTTPQELMLNPTAHPNYQELVLNPTQAELPAYYENASPPVTAPILVQDGVPPAVW